MKSKSPNSTNPDDHESGDPSETELYQAIVAAVCRDSKPIYNGPGAFTVDDIIAIVEKEEGRTISRTSALRRAQKAIKRGELIAVWLVAENITAQPLRGYVPKAAYDEWTSGHNAL